MQDGRDEFSFMSFFGVFIAGKTDGEKDCWLPLRCSFMSWSDIVLELTLPVLVGCSNSINLLSCGSINKESFMKTQQNSLLGTKLLALA